MNFFEAMKLKYGFLSDKNLNRFVNHSQLSDFTLWVDHYGQDEHLCMTAGKT